MKKFAVVIAVLILVGGGLVVTGVGGDLFFKAFLAYGKPAGVFNPDNAVTAPDYSLSSNWAALPSKQDPAELVPQGIEVLPQGEHPVDVFFIHPTGFLSAGSWTSPMDEKSGTEENTTWMMANQASAFNGCCNIFAPRYREANIFSYFGPLDERDKVLGFAYQDVKRAFEYYLQHENNGKPFIIAGHSQGSHHAQRLIKEEIDSSDLHQSMVAAYLIGSIVIPVPPSLFDSMDHIAPCQSAEDLHCVVAWDTMPENAPALERPEPSLCTNPLSWQVNEQRVEADLNEGAVAPVGLMNENIGAKEDVAIGQVFDALDAPIEAATWAQCKNGTLFASSDPGHGFKADAMGTYHVIDYALFYMNIHNNAKLRTSRFLSDQ
jgi:hypothetical protein